MTRMTILLSRMRELLKEADPNVVEWKGMGIPEAVGGRDRMGVLS